MAKARAGKAATPTVAAIEAAGVSYWLHSYAVNPDVDDYGVAVAP